MNKPLILVALLLAISSVPCRAQKKSPQFDYPAFHALTQTAEWLQRYDDMAWITSDSVMAAPKEEIARLDGKWFCLEDKKGQWHAAYGAFPNGQFDQVFHFTAEKNGIQRTHERLDTGIVHSFCRALNLTSRMMHEQMKGYSIRFNQYIRKNGDGSIQVWYFPAFQPDQSAVYGAEFCYKVDASGERLLEDESPGGIKMRTYQVGVDTVAELDYSHRDFPTIGAVFFAWYYKKYFREIRIRTNRNMTTLIYDKQNKGYIWVTADYAPEGRK